MANSMEGLTIGHQGFTVYVSYMSVKRKLVGISDSRDDAIKHE